MDTFSCVITDRRNYTKNSRGDVYQERLSASVQAHFLTIGTSEVQPYKGAPAVCADEVCQLMEERRPTNDPFGDYSQMEQC